MISEPAEETSVLEDLKQTQITLNTASTLVDLQSSDLAMLTDEKNKQIARFIAMERRKETELRALRSQVECLESSLSHSAERARTIASRYIRGDLVGLIPL